MKIVTASAAQKPRRRRPVPTYMQMYAAQLGAIGRSGQRRLRDASVVIVGAGGLGTTIASILVMSGVGTLIVVDPHEFTLDNLNRTVFGHVRDVGRKKTDVLVGPMIGRPYLNIVPIVASGEALCRIDEMQRADVVVAASNTLKSRLFVAKYACTHGLRQISVAVHDGRQRLGGVIAEWHPRAGDVACPGCFLTSGATPRRGEALLASVVGVVGALAAWRTTKLLLDDDNWSSSTNYMTIGLNPVEIQTLRVLRRIDCDACAGRGRPT